MSGKERGERTRTARVVARLRALWADERGDSLIEALTAILIAALGALALATMVTVAVNTSVSNERALAQTYESESGMVQTGDASVTITFGGKWTTVVAQEYASDDGMFVRYADENEPGA